MVRFKILCNGDSIGTVVNGANGVPGTQGIQGVQGIQGEKGDKGDTGEQGVQGEKGDKGDTGEGCTIENDNNTVTLVCGNQKTDINIEEAILNVILGTCGETNENDIEEYGNVYYVCLSSSWTRASTFQKDTYGWTSGENGELKKGNVTDTIYVYNGSKWEVSERETIIGLCVSNNAGEMREYAGTYYICRDNAWDDATETEYDTYGKTCLTDGTIVDGSVIPENKYVCDAGMFRTASAQENSLNKGCVSYTEENIIRKHISASKDSVYLCNGGLWQGSTELVYGTLTDSRDKKVYKTIVIGTQTWMAENLNYSDSHEFANCKSTFEKLVMMQHYFIPTRLLDVSQDPLIGLFFSLFNDPKSKRNDEECEPVILVYEVPKKSIRNYHSDIVSVISNIAVYHYDDLDIRGLSNSTDDWEREKFNENDSIKHLLHEIKAEKPHFASWIKKDNMESVFCVHPLLDNPRIRSQQGAFLLFGMDGDKHHLATLESSKADKIHMAKIHIPQSAKLRLREELHLLGRTIDTVYPDWDGVSDYFTRFYGKKVEEYYR